MNLRTFARRAALFAGGIALAACAGRSGGGCGVGALAGGYAKTQIIENAASVRITRAGLDFLGSALPGLVSRQLGTGGLLTFEIPKVETRQTFLGVIPITLKVCPAGG